MIMVLYVTDPLKLLKYKPGLSLQTMHKQAAPIGLARSLYGARIATRITKKRVSCDGRAQSRA
jgi:hypothetical protein